MRRLGAVCLTSVLGLFIPSAVFAQASITGTERCEIRAAVPEYAVLLSTATSPTQPWCDFTQKLLRATALGSNVIPVVDVQVAGTCRSDQGDELAATWAVPNSATVGLNRAYSGGTTTVNVNLIEPGTLYGERVNNVDLRFAKILRFGRTRTNIGVDIFNLFNADTILTYNQSIAFSGVNTWLRPNSVLTSRFVKVSAQLDFYDEERRELPTSDVASNSQLPSAGFSGSWELVPREEVGRWEFYWALESRVSSPNKILSKARQRPFNRLD